MSTSTVKSFAPWFGSDGGIHDTLIPQFGSPKIMWHLTLGGGASFLASPRCKVETVNDIHPGLINLLRVINSPACPGLQKIWDPLTPSESLFDEAVAFRRENGYPLAPRIFNVERIHIQAAFYLLIEWWLGPGGMVGTAAAEKNPRMSVRYKAGDGGRAASRLRSAINTVPALRARLKGVEILNRDLFELLPLLAERADQDDTTIYLDTPWIGEGHVYAHPFETAEDRPTSMFEPGGGRDRDDFDRLADMLDPIKHARIVVRMGAHPRLDGLFTTGWERIPLTKTNNISNQSGGEGTTKDEVLLIKNGPDLERAA